MPKRMLYDHRPDTGSYRHPNPVWMRFEWVAIAVTVTMIIALALNPEFTGHVVKSTPECMETING